MISRLLIANRGEIARRITRTARDMGIRVIAVYARGDARAPFVEEADEAIALDGSTPSETYLDVEAMLDAARRTGADAIHPGYGFLAEDAAFARAVTEAGLVWVGPPPDAIEAMGDKLASKRLMAEAGVPVLEGIEIDGDALPDGTTFPALVKAAGGGGGRGMRVVRKADEAAAAIASARREAARAFGNDTLFVEPYVEGSRHVEVQVLADAHGNVVGCFERECSVQRRYQKIVEEAPSPAVDEALRSKLGDAAVAAARAVGYRNAGTVEFLLGADGRFHFMEMNTRLQVEHPVTEAICGLDIVREQLLIAQGERLEIQPSIDGHAIEVRLYAEDPANDFLPSVGVVRAWEPAAGARFDSGIEAGTSVTSDFDPLLAKVIVHAPTRAEAARRLALVLERTVIHGVGNNRDFLVAVLRHPEFEAGATTTDLLERIEIPLKRMHTADEIELAMTAAAMFGQHSNRGAATVLTTIASGWRNSVMPPQRVRYRYREDEHVVEYANRRDGSFAVTIGERTRAVRVMDVDERVVDLDVEGLRTRLRVTRDGLETWVHGPTGDVELVEVPRFPPPKGVDIAGGLSAPMPGKIVAVHVSEGSEVEAGQVLVVMEAMKMEHQVPAPHAGTVTEILVAVGDQVTQGAVLLALSEGADPTD